MLSERNLTTQRGGHRSTDKGFTGRAINNFLDKMDDALDKMKGAPENHSLRRDLQFIGRDGAVATLDNLETADRLEELYSVYRAGVNFANLEEAANQVELYMTAHEFEGDPLDLLDAMAEQEGLESRELLEFIIAHYAADYHPELLE